MNTNKKTSLREAVHVRSILIAAPADDDSIFGRKLAAKQLLKQSGAGWLSFVKIKGKITGGQVELGGANGKPGANLYSLPSFLAIRAAKVDDSYVFEPIVVKLNLKQITAFFVCVPFLPLFEELFKTKPKTFYRTDLRRVCDDQFSGAGDANIKITRLHSKLEGDLGERISSLTFIGKNVVTSAVTRDVLCFNSTRAKLATPFSAAAIEKKVVGRVLDPVSCRVKWDDGSENGAALNLDRYGNFSFYLKNLDTINQLVPIFAYLARINALPSCGIDPLERSDAALHEVETSLQ